MAVPVWHSPIHTVRRGVPADRYALPPALKVDEGAVGDHRARHLIRWYNRGADGQIPWGAPGDFDACVTVATEHAGDQMSPGEIKGFCANRHHDALGIWPATHAARERGKVLVPDLIKVGPKGYIHGWIFVGAPGVGAGVHHPKHGRGVVSHHDEHGHVHVRFDSGEKRSFEARGTGDGKLRERSEASNDAFTRHLKAAAAANRRKDHAAAAEHYRKAAEVASHPKIKQEMLDRAARDAAKVKPEKVEPEKVEPEKVEPEKVYAAPLRPETHAAVREAVRQLPKTADEWNSLFRKKVEGGPRRYVDRRVLELEQDHKRDADSLARAKQALERETEQIKTHLKQRGIAPRSKQFQQAVENHTTYYREEVAHAEHAERASRNLYEKMRDVADDPVKLRAIIGRDAAEYLAKELPPQYESAYPKDARDYRMPPAELKAHHERVMAAGKALHDDLRQAFRNDARLKDIDTRMQALVDPKGFAAGATVVEKMANRREATRLKIERARIQKELVHDALGQIRPFGGVSHGDVQMSADADIAKMPKSWRAGGIDVQRARADWRDQIAVGEQHFPKDWLATSSTKPLDVASSPRAFHSRLGGRFGGTVLALSTDVNEGAYDGGFDTKVNEITTHEMGHRMEVAIPGLTALEFAYVRSKTTDEHGNVEAPVGLKALYGGSYADSESAFKDEFPNAYTGKTYEDGKHADPASLEWEAFQVGLQDVYGRGSARYGDESLQHFVLGVLATLHRLEEQ